MSTVSKSTLAVSIISTPYNYSPTQLAVRTATDHAGKVKLNCPLLACTFDSDGVTKVWVSELYASGSESASTVNFPLDIPGIETETS